MLSARKGPHRFTLLLLEENEIYLGNWVASCQWPLSSESTFQKANQLSGTLRLCSKSLFFEPDDARLAIARLPFEHTLRLEGEGKRSFVLTSAVVIKMKANMADAPYLVEKQQSSRWHFALAYANTDSFLPLAHQCLTACKLPYADRELALTSMSQSQAQEAIFDTSRLVDFTERIHFDRPAEQLTPLVRESGRLVVTQLRVYFQPLHDIVGDAPVRSRELFSVAAVARRRSSLRQIGLEIFFLDEAGQAGAQQQGSSPPSVFYAFASQDERESAIAALTAQAKLGAGVPGGHDSAVARAGLLEGQARYLHQATQAWQQGRINNFDYLLFCNLAAGRSFNDLTQWPVFPWILSNYASRRLDISNPAVFRDLSRPIGALNQQRLELLRRRFRDMTGGPDAPFLYGTHYSCPGYIMYWLVRAAPAHLLRLQNGKFDAPDRMFCSVGDSWSSVTSNAADVKELIPEFFLPNPRFLKNMDKLALGTRQNGRVVGDVELPPWAGSPSEFVELHRAAIESPYVSANLHHWLDLIFGYKQQGAAAVEADNVFHHLTYEGAVDIESVADGRERLALEAQINEFGQCPRVLFPEPHPRRLVCPSTDTALQLAAEAMQAGRAQGGPGSESAGRASVSLALLSTIMTVSEPHASSTEPAEVPTILEQLDVAAGSKALSSTVDDAQAAIHSDRQSSSASASASHPAAAMPEPTSPAAATAGTAPVPTDKRLPDRMRNWSGRLGGQITTLVDNLKRTHLEQQQQQQQPVSPVEQGVGATLRGMFQRQQPGHAASQPTQLNSAADTSVTNDSAAIHPDITSTVQDDTDSAGEVKSVQISSNSPAVDHVPVPTDSAAQPQQPGQENGSPTTSPRRDNASAGHGLQSLLQAGEAAMQWHSIAALSGGAAAVALTVESEELVAYAAGHNGALKAFSLQSKSQLRTAKLGSVPLTSLVLLEETKTPLSGQAHVLAGSYDNRVYSLSADEAQRQGSWEAHEDAVSCLARAQYAADTLITASWDCSVRLWSLAEGRSPWLAEQPVAQAELADHDAGIWSMAVADNAHVIATGTEDGHVVLWDSRSSSSQWQVSVCQDCVRGLALTPSQQQLVAASSDGRLSLLDMRRGGACICSTGLSTPVRCCLADEHLAAAGTAIGQVQLWDFGHQQGRVGHGSLQHARGSLHAPLLADSHLPVNAIAKCPATQGCTLIAAHDDGHLSWA